MLYNVTKTFDVLIAEAVPGSVGSALSFPQFNVNVNLLKSVQIKNCHGKVLTF